MGFGKIKKKWIKKDGGYKPTRKYTRRKSRKVPRSKNRGPTTSKQKTMIMADRTFVRFPFTCLSVGYNGNTTGNGYNSANPQGMLQFGSGANVFDTHLTSNKFVFTPHYVVTTAGSANTLYNMHMLPGNSLCLASQNSVTGTSVYPDIFKQVQPTGTQPWQGFYNKYICHGSSIEVTLLNCMSPGQLIVIPVTTQSGDASLNQAGGYGYDFYPAQTLGSQQRPININQLLADVYIPDDQPHAKVKLVSASGGMDKIIIRHKMLTKQLYDVKTLRDDDENKGVLPYQVTPGTFGQYEPISNQWVWYISFVPNANFTSVASPTVQCTVQVKIHYFCELTDRQELANVHA